MYWICVLGGLLRAFLVEAIRALALLLVTTLGTASAAEVYPAGTVGLDISWPQCGLPMPAAAGTFMVVGVTGGRAFTLNPCFAQQVAWAKTQSVPVSLYVNMKYPSGTTLSEGLTGPQGTCIPDDWVCQSANYGYKTAQHAYDTAQAAGVTPAMWWLDVETENTWSETTTLNALVIRSAVGFFQSRGLPVGVYSTAFQWKLIAGDYTPGLPVWVGGSAASSTDPQRCRTGAFAGGQVVMIQYLQGGFDTNYVCRAVDYLAPTATPSPTLTSAPSSVVVTPTATPTPPPGTIAGKVPPQGFGLVVYNGGTLEQLVAASGCARATSAFFFTFEGRFVVYVPGAQVAAANAEVLSKFTGGNVPGGTALIGKCA